MKQLPSVQQSFEGTITELVALNWFLPREGGQCGGIMECDGLLSYLNLVPSQSELQRRWLEQGRVGRNGVRFFKGYPLSIRYQIYIDIAMLFWKGTRMT